MTLARFSRALEALLQGDLEYDGEPLAEGAGFVDALTDLLQVASPPVVLQGNRPLGQVSRQPAWVIEVGPVREGSIADGVGSALTVSGYEQGFIARVFLVLVWTENDEELAAEQRKSLPDLVVPLMLHNPCLGGVLGARVVGWEPDRGALHPQQVWRAELEIDLVISRDEVP